MGESPADLVRGAVVVLVAVALLAASCGSASAPTAADPAVQPSPTLTSVADAPEPTALPAPTPTATAVQRSTPTTPMATATPQVANMVTALTYGPEPDQIGWLYEPANTPPSDGYPVVVLIHGGFWRDQFDASLMEGLATDLASRGYTVWNVEYRRVDGAGGWPATGTDVAAAIDYLADIAISHPVDLDRVVSVGHSAGGHLGLWALGREDRVQLRGSVGLGAVVDLAYFGQAQGLLGGTIEQVPDVYADAAPVLDPERAVLIQGSNDFIVPAASLQVARDAQVSIVTVEGDDHFDLIDAASASWLATLDAIEQFVS